MRMILICMSSLSFSFFLKPSNQELRGELRTTNDEQRTVNRF
jgi:hypothetical protein